MALPTNTIWLKHNEYPKYLFSPEGNMLSLSSRKVTKGTVAIPKNRKSGYSVVHLIDKQDKWVTRRVHRIVAEIYCENSDNKPQVNHIDGNKQNNHYMNLEFCTNKENAEHSMHIGLTAKGETLGKLNNKEVLDILEQSKKGKTLKEIATQYHISGVTVYKILSGKTWAHVTGVSSKSYKFKERYSHKLNKFSVAEIKKLLEQNNSVSSRRDIANKFNVSMCAINDIHKKRTWRDVP